jgi:hypothetical protein
MTLMTLRFFGSWIGAIIGAINVDQRALLAAVVN